MLFVYAFVSCSDATIQNVKCDSSAMKAWKDSASKYEFLQPEVAINYYDSLISCDSTSAKDHYKRGFLYSGSGLNQEALEDFQKAELYGFDDQFGDLRYSLSRTHARLKNREEALHYLEQGYNFDKDSVRYLLNYSSCLMSFEEWQAALDVFNDLENKKKDLYIIYLDRGKTHIMLGDTLAGCSDLEKAFELEPNLDPGFWDLFGCKNGNPNKGESAN